MKFGLVRKSRMRHVVLYDTQGQNVVGCTTETWHCLGIGGDNDTGRNIEDADGQMISLEEGLEVQSSPRWRKI
jgi:hypothetical protein